MTSKEKYAKEAKVMLEAARILRRLQQKRPLKDQKKPTLKVNRRFNTCGGRATYSKMLIELNAAMLHEHQDQIEQVVAHEYAHLLAYDLCTKRGRGHGAFWRQCMRDLGYKPDIYHKMEPIKPRRFQARIPVKCKCDIHFLTKYKYERRHRYRCSKCRENLG